MYMYFFFINFDINLDIYHNMKNNPNIIYSVLPLNELY